MFCARTGCSEANFEKALFRRAVFPVALPFSVLIRLVYPRFFKFDDEILKRVGEAQSFTDLTFQADSVRLHYRKRDRDRFLRSVLKMRVSGQRLVDIAAKYWEPSLKSGSGRSSPKSPA